MEHWSEIRQIQQAKENETTVHLKMQTMGKNLMK